MSLFGRIKEMYHTLSSDERYARFRSFLPPLNFITVHYTYFIVTCLIFSLIFWGSSDPAKSISYTDSLFLVVSAMTEAGLNTVNLSQMTLFQQLLLWILIVMGSSIVVSISTVLIRKRVFEKRFKSIVKRQKELGRHGQHRGRSRSMSTSVSSTRDRERQMSGVEERLGEARLQEEEREKDSHPRVDGDDDAGETNDPADEIAGPSEHSFGLGALKPEGQKTPFREINFDLPVVQNVDGVESSSSKAERAGQESRPSSRGSRRRNSVNDLPVSQALSQSTEQSTAQPRVLNFIGVGTHPNANGNTTSAYKLSNANGLIQRKVQKIEGKIKKEISDLDHAQYPSYLTRHTTGRNGQFYGLTRAEREHLGGVEYRAIQLLSWVVPAYFILWQLLGCTALGAYVAYNKASTAEDNGINPWWLGIFNGASACKNPCPFACYCQKIGHSDVFGAWLLLCSMETCKTRLFGEILKMPC